MKIFKRTLAGIKTLEYTDHNASKLIFLQHGIHSNKEKVMQSLGVSFQKLGYHVIGIDAYKHGDRIEEPFLSKDEVACELETVDVVKRTVEDIERLYQNYFKDAYATYNIIGISMGGLIAHTLTTFSSHLDTVVALISSPRLLEAAEYAFPAEKQAKYPLESEKAKQKIRKIDPSLHTHKMQFNRLIMLNGVQDLIIPYIQSESFKEEHPEMNIIYRSYETDHKISKEMHEDLLEMLRQN